MRSLNTVYIPKLPNSYFYHDLSSEFQDYPTDNMQSPLDCLTGTANMLKTPLLLIHPISLAVSESDLWLTC